MITIILIQKLLDEDTLNNLAIVQKSLTINFGFGQLIYFFLLANSR